MFCAKLFPSAKKKNEENHSRKLLMSPRSSFNSSFCKMISIINDELHNFFFKTLKKWLASVC